MHDRAKEAKFNCCTRRWIRPSLGTARNQETIHMGVEGSDHTSLRYCGKQFPESAHRESGTLYQA
jgi:hypothetical protein